MRQRVRSVVSFANVVSLCALFIALGGTSYAVARNSIDTREIRNNDVRSWDIRNSTIRSRDLRNSAIRTQDVRNGTLLPRDFKEGQIPTASDSLSSQTPEGQTSDSIDLGFVTARVVCRQGGAGGAGTTDFIQVFGQSNAPVNAYSDSRAGGMDQLINSDGPGGTFANAFDRLIIQVTLTNDRSRVATIVATNRHANGVCDFQMQGTATEKIG